MTFENVSASALANVYFDGEVVSHSLTLADGEKVTLGLIYPGEYHFATESAERMEMTTGQCAVTLDGEKEATIYPAGSHFEVPENSRFTISTAEGICQYICTFLS
ncbi:MAG: pyrimidine/purine nucleoside phosphorylase [Verrucomicrobiales bacterium]